LSHAPGSSEASSRTSTLSLFGSVTRRWPS
jgi:hypothetical protein